MSDKKFSKMLVLALFNAAVDFLGEVKTERQRMKSGMSDTDSGLGQESSRFAGQRAGVVHTTGGRRMHIEDRSHGFAPGLLLGSLLGGLIGAALALWYAPQAGKKTQAMLKREASHLQKQVNKKASNLVSSAEELANEAAERASELADQGRNFVQGKARSLKEAVER